MKLLGFLESFFDPSKKDVKRMKKAADRIVAMEDKYAAMSDEELKNQTNIKRQIPLHQAKVCKNMCETKKQRNSFTFATAMILLPCLSNPHKIMPHKRNS